MAFYKVSKHNTFNTFFLVDVKDVLKQKCPEPDPAIVKRLISYYGGTNYSISLPWQTTPTQGYYDQEEVKSFARVLTL